jgi:hypothetical protein
MIENEKSYNVMRNKESTNESLIIEI